MVLGRTDMVLLVLSLMASAAIGLYYSITGRRSTPLEYLLGGRSMRPLPLALSMMVGTVSAITIMGNAGEMYAYGTQLWVMDMGMLLGLIIIARVFIPIMYPLHMVSLYQYVEQRFKSKRLRQATVLLQLLGGYSFIGFLLFPPSIALMIFTGLSITYNIIIIGTTCTLYSAFGGVKAVVYTDVLQSLVMVTGVLAIIIQGSLAKGGFDNVLHINFDNQRIEFFNFDLNPYQRHSFWLCVIYGFFFTMGTYGVNQSQTQRYFSTGTVRQAQWVLYYAAMGMVVLRGLIHVLGLVMFAHYQGCDPLTKDPARPRDPSTVVVSYVNSELTKIPGLAGLFVAAVYAAVLSSVSTQLNSMTALLWEDFLKTKRIFASWSEVKVGGLQKVMVLATGVLGIALGLAVSQLGWSFLRTVLAINGALSGPLIGLFLSAVFLPWVTAKGTSVAFLVSIVVNVTLAVGQLSLPEATRLPLSRDSCPAPALPAPPANLTTSLLLDPTTSPLLDPDTTPFTDFTTTSTPVPPASSSLPGEWLFGLSYCLNPLWGSVLCILLSLLISAITGPNTPKDVDEKLIAQWSWRVFQRPVGEQLVEWLLCRRKPDAPAAPEPTTASLLTPEGKEAKNNDIESRGQ